MTMTTATAITTTLTVSRHALLEGLKIANQYSRDFSLLSWRGDTLEIESFSPKKELGARYRIKAEGDGPDFTVMTDPKPVRDYLSKRKSPSVPIVLTDDGDTITLGVGECGFVVLRPDDRYTPPPSVGEGSRRLRLPSRKLLEAFRAVQPTVGEYSKVSGLDRKRVFLSCTEDDPTRILVFSTNGASGTLYPIRVRDPLPPFNIGVSNDLVGTLISAKDDGTTTTLEWVSNAIEICTSKLRLVERYPTAIEFTAAVGEERTAAILDRPPLVRNLEIARSMGLEFVHVEFNPITQTIRVKNWNQDCGICVDVAATVSAPAKLVLNVEFLSDIVRGKGTIEMILIDVNGREAIGTRFDGGISILAPAASSQNWDARFRLPTKAFPIVWDGPDCWIVGSKTEFRITPDQAVKDCLISRTQDGSAELNKAEFAALYGARI